MTSMFSINRFNLTLMSKIFEELFSVIEFNIKIQYYFFISSKLSLVINGLVFHC